MPHISLSLRQWITLSQDWNHSSSHFCVRLRGFQWTPNIGDYIPTFSRWERSGLRPITSLHKLSRFSNVTKFRIVFLTYVMEFLTIKSRLVVLYFKDAFSILLSTYCIASTYSSIMVLSCFRSLSSHLASLQTLEVLPNAWLWPCFIQRYRDMLFSQTWYDRLIMIASKKLLIQHIHLVLTTCQNLGLVVNREKSRLKSSQ